MVIKPRMRVSANQGAESQDYRNQRFKGLREQITQIDTAKIIFNLQLFCLCLDSAKPLFFIGKKATFRGGSLGKTNGLRAKIWLVRWDIQFGASSMKPLFAATAIALSISSVCSAQDKLQISLLGQSHPNWIHSANGAGVTFFSGTTPEGFSLCVADYYDGIAFQVDVLETVSATYTMSWIGCVDDPSTEIIEGPDYPSYAAFVSTTLPENNEAPFGLEKIESDWIEQGRPSFWSGTLSLDVESVQSPVFFINMQGTIQIDEAKDEPCLADVDGDGTIGFPDILIILSNWGVCP